MAVYKFRVTFEDFDDVSRDIEIKPNQTFEDLHQAIQKSINFDGSDKGNFYSSDDYWRHGEQVGQGNISNAKLLNFIEDPHQKFVYEFGDNGKWSFFVELLKIQPDENGQTYPRCVKTSGKAPAQYLKTEQHAISEEDTKVAPFLIDDLIDDAAFYDQGEELEADIFDGEEEETATELVDHDEMEAQELQEEDEFGAEFSDNEHPEEDY